MTGILLVYGFFIFIYFTNVSSQISDRSIPEIPEPERNCTDLNYLSLQCPDYHSDREDCIYGNWMTINCIPHPKIKCLGSQNITRQARCIFCYQAEKWEYTCDRKSNCISGQSKYCKFNCTVHNDVICLGSRTFEMKLRWNCTRGHKWSTALMLSVTLGGFGADRFYLGHWQEGIGKLFSFGGLGVWTLVDVLLIAIRYLGPADGSFYV